jgi:3-oxoacyl-[acyl-carrier protein] reductase
VDLTDAVTIVTGGANGLGRSIVARLIGADARVVVFDRDPEAIAEVTRTLGPAMTRTVNLTDTAAADAAVDEVSSELGPVQVLVNNAGIIRNAPLVDVTRRTTREQRLDIWHQVIAINLTSIYTLSMAVAEQMIRQRVKGVIVNISSISAHGNPGQSAYSAAKAGVNALTVTWARELGTLGLRFVAVAPGFADTPSTRAALSESRLDDLVNRIPMRRLADADEIAFTVEHAIRNDYLNGAVIPVDGGLVL